MRSMQGKKPPYAAAPKRKRAATDPKKGTQKTRGGRTGRDKTMAAAAGSTRGAALIRLEEADDLPVVYNETRVVLTVVDPYLVNVRWDLNPRQLTRVKKMSVRGGRTSFPVLRFHEVPGPVFADDHVRSRFDVEIDLGAANWYVPLWRADKTYFVDLGFRTTEGLFYPLARSNTAVVPPSGPAEKDASHLIIVTEERGIVETVEVAPPAPLERPQRTTPGEDDGLRKGDAVALPDSGARRPASLSLTARDAWPSRHHAIGIEVLWAVPEEARQPLTDEPAPTPEWINGVDLVSRAERLFTPGMSS
jgi:hypothetical protein